MRAVIHALLVTFVLGAVSVACSSRSGAPPSRSAAPAATGTGQPLPSLTPGVAAGATSWTTYHADNARDGLSPGATSFRTVTAGWQSPALDGAVYAEPLVSDGEVYVATERDRLFALDQATGKIEWSLALGTPVDASAFPCGNVNPLGITSTPVVDPARNELFAAGMVSTSAGPQHRLFAVDLATHRLVYSVPIDPPGSDPRIENQRGALALFASTVYVPFGGRFGDCGDYHGYVVAAAVTDGHQLGTFQSTRVGPEGGIWAPSGPAIDGAGNVFVATGNGNSGSTYDRGDSVIKLSPALSELSSFAPSNWQQLDQRDLDLGSVGPLLIGGGLVFQVGKSGVGYLLHANSLGGIGGEAFSADVCPRSGAFGGAATASGRVYVACSNALVALNTNPPQPSFTVSWVARNISPGPPIVAGGAVWVVDIATGTLRAFDPAAGAPRFTAPIGSVAPFSTPSASGNQLFVAGGGVIHSFVLHE